MASFPGMILTDAGRVIQSKAQTGQALVFLRVAIGDGAEPLEPAQQTALVNERHSLLIQDHEVVGDGTSRLRVVMTNQALEEGFFVRELGVIARDPDTLDEVLYAYTNSGSQPDYLPAAGGPTLVEQIFDLYTVIGTADNVTAIINDYITIATKEDIEELRTYLVPRGGIVGQLMRKASNEEGDTEWFDPAEGLNLRVHSIVEERVAVEGQKVFNLSETITNGLAVYVEGVRLAPSEWVALNASQVQLDDALSAGTVVQFINNEEVGTASLARVSLTGPTLVYAGSSNEYTITDFDDFSTYSVTATVGTATLSGETIDLDIPAGSEAGTLVLTVTRNDGSNSFVIAIGGQTVVAPQILNPANGAENVSIAPTLTTSPFQAYPIGASTHASTDWQVAADAAFTEVVFESMTDSANLESIVVPSETLETETMYHLRARHNSSSIGASEWSVVASFTTVAAYVVAPTITSPSAGAIDIGETPTLSTGSFASYGDSDTHLNTDWEIVTAAGLLVWSSAANSTYKTSIVVPAGNLTANTAYKVRVRHRGATIGASAWSELSFTTGTSFGPAVVGQAYGGGYYAGTYNGYHYIVAPKAIGEAYKTWGPDGENARTYDFNDGPFNTVVLVSKGTAYAAANFCDNLTIGGYEDWFMPGIGELRFIYAACKESGAAPWNGTESFAASSYWSSTELNFKYCWAHTFWSGGNEYNPTKDSFGYVRAVRRIPV